MISTLSSFEKRNKITKRVNTDVQYPRYHFIAPEGNVMPFDPNGALCWNGKYHLFYIFQDPKLAYGGHCLGHASSKDLLQWMIVLTRELYIILFGYFFTTFQHTFYYFAS